MTASAGRRRGSKPQATNAKVPVSVVPRVISTGHPILSLKHLQPGWGIENMSAEMCQEFMSKWAKRSAFTWAELATHPKHGLGSEKLPKSKFNIQIPETLSQDEYKVMRHHGNLPFVGIQAADIFYVLWIECEYGDLYDHG